MTEPLHTLEPRYQSKAARHEAWVKANWQRWKNKGSYLEGYRVDMDEVHEAWLLYYRELYGDATPISPVAPPPCRAIVVYRPPVAVPPPVITPAVICLPAPKAPLTVSLWHAAMAA